MQVKVNGKGGARRRPSVFEAENELLRLRVTQPSADHLFDVDRIVAEAFEDFFLFDQPRLQLRQPAATRRLVFLQPIVFRSRFPKIHPRRHAQREEEQQVNRDDEAAKCHVETGR